MAEFVSVSVAVTVLVLLNEPEALVLISTINVIVALLPELMVPRLPVTVPDAWVAVPWLAVAELNVVPDGKASVTVTLVAVDGPLLVTVMV